MRGEKVREGERDDIVRLIKAGGRKKKNRRDEKQERERAYG
jgi:hypothetical protein